jgi:hypothetical protein
MVVAMVPLLIAKGAGAASRFDIGVVIAAGMTIGTLFTLFVTPAVYTYLARDHQKARQKHAAEPHETVEASDEAAKAGLLFPGEVEPIPGEGVLSTEAHAFSTAAAAATGPAAERQPSRRRGRRKPYPTAAE